MKNLLKSYKIGFDIGAIIIFMIVMLPNFIWFGIPASNDILRAESVTETVDTIASIFQVIMIACMCMLVNKDANKLSLTLAVKGVILCILIYFVCWIAYYTGVTNAVVILGLTLPPCIVFVLYGIDRKNYIAFVPALAFLICHLIYALVNYIM